MTREQASKAILGLTYLNVLVELPTGYGKTKIALDCLKKYKPKSILIVVPRLVLIQNWKDEFEKWGMISVLPNVTFTTYVSFPKNYVTREHWDYVVFDEAHHLSERCRDAITENDVTFGRSILLSATVNKALKMELPYVFSCLYTFKVSMKQAIKEEVLPDPKVILMPISLDNINPCFEIVRGNKKSKTIVRDTYQNRFNYKNEKTRRVILSCTQKQFYEDMEGLIRWYKTKMFLEAFKNLYLHSCGKRNIWLSDQKTEYVQLILQVLKDKRTLTFCNGIEHTKALGQYCINSSNKKDSDLFLNAFNQGKINHITACNILDEGELLRPYPSNSVSVK